MMELAVIGFTLLCWLLFFRRMVPLLSKRKFTPTVRMTLTSVDGSTRTLTRLEEGRQSGGSRLSTLMVGGGEDRSGKLSISH
jgi:hypothetical protein